MPISASSKHLLNNFMGAVAKKVGLGDLLDTSTIIVASAANVATVALAANVISIPGVLATDKVFVTIRTVGGTPRTIVSAVPAADQITVTFSGDPSTDHRIDYMVVRSTV